MKCKYIVIERIYFLNTWIIVVSGQKTVISNLINHTQQVII